MHYALLKAIMEKMQNREVNAVRRYLIGAVAVLVIAVAVLGNGNMHKDSSVEETGCTVEETELFLQTPETIPEEIASEEKTEYSFVPSYFQTDYPYIKFGNGTIATSGCSITCLAMIATYLTDQEYTPVQMAYHFGRYGT